MERLQSNGIKEVRNVFGGFIWLLQALASGEITPEEMRAAAIGSSISVSKLSASLLLLANANKK